MAAGYQELFIEQGSDYATTITLDSVDGTPFNLAEYVAKSQIRKSYYSTSPTAEFVIGFPDAANGTISVTLSSANTANIAPGRYVYDMIIKNNQNITTRVLEGIVNVLPQVTVF
jgi:hypothetical protein